MNTSQSTTEITKALVSFQTEVDKVNKDASNPFFRSKYASLANILDAIHQPLIKAGLAVVQFPEGQYGLTSRVMHTSGEWMESTYEMKPVKDDPQGRGSAITYQRRYALVAILSLNVDDDDDGNKATYPNGKGQQTAPNKSTSPTQGEKQDLCNLVERTDLSLTEVTAAVKAIADCKDYKTYEAIQHRLEARLRPSLNPSASETNKLVKRRVENA